MYLALSILYLCIFKYFSKKFLILLIFKPILVQSCVLFIFIWNYKPRTFELRIGLYLLVSIFSCSYFMLLHACIILFSILCFQVPIFFLLNSILSYLYSFYSRFYFIFEFFFLWNDIKWNLPLIQSRTCLCFLLFYFFFSWTFLPFILSLNSQISISNFMYRVLFRISRSWLHLYQISKIVGAWHPH